jgi:hypothetical protein
VIYKKINGGRETVYVKVTVPVDVNAPVLPAKRESKLLISYPPTTHSRKKKKILLELRHFGQRFKYAV